jgi:chloramphenicol-sensitive protein RarD
VVLAFVGVALLVMRRWAWAGELLRQPRKLALITVAAASSPSTGASTSGP